MELKKKQKELVLKLVADGLETDEINAHAAKFKPPFSVSRQQVDFYRRSRGVKLKELVEESETEALRSGLALRNERVACLERLCRYAEQIVLTKELNPAEIKICRDLLDDIAKEMNGRTYERRDSLRKEEEEPSEVKITVAYEEKPKQVEE
ncbi:MAG: hypothetical protein WCF57_20210 [Pyrinomonadaceae bacterium]